MRPARLEMNFPRSYTQSGSSVGWPPMLLERNDMVRITGVLYYLSFHTRPESDIQPKLRLQGLFLVYMTIWNNKLYDKVAYVH